MSTRLASARSAAIRALGRSRKPKPDQGAGEEANARLAAIVESSPSAIIALRPDGTIESWNAAAERLYGYSAAEAAGRSIALLDAPGQPAVFDQVAATVAGGTFRFSTESVAQSGARIGVEVTMSPICLREQAIIGVSCLIVDVGERVREQRELVRLAEAAELGTDAVISIDLEQKVRHWNRGAERLYGFSAEEAIGRRLDELTVFTGEPDRHIAQMLAGEACYQDETRRRRKDGTMVDVLLTISPWHLDGQVVGVTGIAIDLSDRRRVERAREKAMSDLEEAQRIASIGSWSWNPRTDEGHWSAQMYEIFGRDPADGPATNEAFDAYVHPEDRNAFATAYENTRGSPDPFEIDFQIVTGDGSQRTLHGLGHADPDGSGSYLGTVQDVTERRRAEAELRHSEERLRASFEGAPTGVAMVEAHPPFTVLQVNGALTTMLGVEPDQLVGSSALTLIDESGREAAQSTLGRLLGGGERSAELEIELLHFRTGPLWVNLTGAVITGVDGGLEHVVLHMQNITDRKRYEAELRNWADRDPLTALLNRRRMEEELHRILAGNTPHGTSGALLLCDVDNLKLVNDTLGHKAGDELIKGVARALAEHIRDSDVLARTGGDEFALVMPDTGLEQARATAERLRASLLDLDVVVGPHRVRTTLSIGIAPVGDGLSAEDSLAAADLAMYDAKRHGRNRVSASTRAFSADVMTQQLSWLGRLRSALADGRFELYAQPIVELASRAVRCRELLLRMHDEDGELLLPADFIPTAERFGMIADIDRWVVCEAIRILAADRSSGITYTINLSGVSVGDPELLSLIEAEIVRSGADPSRLIFEFTETAAIGDLVASREFTEELSRIGCASALDDFGSGFGSFAYLKQLPVQYLKIDGEFVRNLPGTDEDRVLVKAIIDLARGLRKQTIAEFVGSEEALELLREYGVDYAQGFYLGMPEPLPPPD